MSVLGFYCECCNAHYQWLGVFCQGFYFVKKNKGNLQGSKQGCTKDSTSTCTDDSYFEIIGNSHKTLAYHSVFADSFYHFESLLVNLKNIL